MSNDTRSEGSRPVPLPPDPRRLRRRKAAAEFLSISEERLARLAVTGGGPVYHKPAGARVCLYSEQALLDWLGAPVSCTTEAKARDRARSAA
ncbi:MAG: hypothetical protein IPJ78_13445 [Gemmatimonadetes bacterium]|nr:hypothetical protein [Gemmatimonadota bacterium]